jgi:RNA polymerase sigma-70 factor, ECF subfamily
MVDSGQQLTDEQLFARFIAGQSQAFDELVNRYYKQIYRFLVRFTGRPHLAEDLIQDIFVKVYRSAQTFDPTRKFRPWLYSIAANRARDALRSASRLGKQIVVHHDDADGHVSLENLLPGAPSPPDQELIAQETTQRVKQALKEMPEPLREILVLAYYDQISYKEIADILEIPLGTVKSRLHKAVMTFGEIWKRYEPDESGKL